jgi:hypothetical protein
MKRVIFTTIATAILLPMALYLLWPAQAAQQANMNGPILYGITSGGALYKVDVMNCTACPIADFAGNGVPYDVLVLPNGDVLVQSAFGLYRYTLPSNAPIWTETNTVYAGSVLAPNGTIYLARSFPTYGLATYDPATNTITYIGDWPPGMQIDEFFYQNGVLYGFGVQSGSGVLVEINTTNPGLSTVIYSGLNIGGGGTTNNGYSTANSVLAGDILEQYNVITNTFDFVCDLDIFIMGSNGFSGLSDLPAGAPEAPCLCITFAGTVNTTTFNVCVPGSVTVPYNSDATLDGNDILRYILFSDPADTLGSIIVQSSSATIDFNPATMQTGVTYYLATIAGDNLNGSVDLDDPCLDISDEAAQVTWRPQAAVVFNVGNPNICVGKCTTVTATFTGTPPFTLTYTVFGNTVTETFNSNSGSFEVCVPAGAVQGGIILSAVGLEDAWCACQ